MRTDTPMLRGDVPAPPRGWERLAWWGPGVLWAMSAVGSGSVLFTPRVGSQYGYSFLWLLLAVACLMWVMIREAGRFTVATGRSMLDGFATLPGPRNWALWVVFVPQLVAAVVGIGGLAAIVGSTLASELPGELLPWSLVTLSTCITVVVGGGYRAVSKVALGLALVLVSVTVVAAVGVFESGSEPARGLMPGFPPGTDIPFLLPWIGTILAGSMGIIWFAYWAAARGFAGGHSRAGADGSSGRPDPEQQRRIAAWFRELSITAAVGVATGTLVIGAFLVLGAELLGPRGIVPSGTAVAEDLTKLLGAVWGTIGHWLMVAAILVAIGGSVLANQDGWPRSFADITLLLSRRPGDASGLARPVRALLAMAPRGMSERRALKSAYALVVAYLLPAVVVVLVRDPVAIMSVSGIVATLHTPFIVLTVLAVNRHVPEPLAPRAWELTVLGLAGLFYTIFAVLYLGDVMGVLG
jgi:Mn2+/Fe2+ NRAMP family transporter